MWSLPERAAPPCGRTAHGLPDWGWGEPCKNHSAESSPVLGVVQKEDPKSRRNFIQEVKMLVSDAEILPSLHVIDQTQ